MQHTVTADSHLENSACIETSLSSFWGTLVEKSNHGQVSYQWGSCRLACEPNAKSARVLRKHDYLRKASQGTQGCLATFPQGYLFLTYITMWRRRHAECVKKYMCRRRKGHL
jgi:hypothetical protein